MSQLFMNETTGRIKSIRITDAIFSYSYLTMPRPEGQFKAGSYGTELIIRDEETVKLLNQYLKEAVTNAIKEVWNGKLPKDVYLPLEQGDDDVESEAGAYVLKTTSPTQPPLYIRNEGEAYPRKVTDDEIDEIYAGMEGEAYVVFSPFNYQGKAGVTAYINGVCKTGEGTPFGGRTNLEEVFAVPENASMDFSAPAAKTPAGKTTKKAEVIDEEPEVDLAALTKKHSASKATVKADDAVFPAHPTSKKKLTIEDLI